MKYAIESQPSTPYVNSEAEAIRAMNSFAPADYKHAFKRAFCIHNDPDSTESEKQNAMVEFVTSFLLNIHLETGHSFMIGSTTRESLMAINSVHAKISLANILKSIDELKKSIIQQNRKAHNIDTKKLVTLTANAIENLTDLYALPDDEQKSLEALYTEMESIVNQTLTLTSPSAARETFQFSERNTKLISKILLINLSNPPSDISKHLFCYAQKEANKHSIRYNIEHDPQQKFFTGLNTQLSNMLQTPDNTNGNLDSLLYFLNDYAQRELNSRNLSYSDKFTSCLHDTCICVTHEPSEAAKVAFRNVVLDLFLDVISQINSREATSR